MRSLRGIHPRALLLVVLIAGLLAAGCGDDSSADPAATSVNGLISKGLAAQGKGDNEGATAAYQAVLVKDPQNKYALYNLGTIDQLAGREAEAEPRYRAALAADPNFEPALFNLAIITTKTAPQEAAVLYGRVIALDPERAGAHYNLGVVLRSLGKTKEADQSFAKATALDPTLTPPPA